MLKLNKAEINIQLDREYLRTNGMSTGQIASTIRTALFGKDVSTYDYEDDSYDLNVRLGREFRGGIDDLLDQKIMFMNNKGQKLNIPIRSVVKGRESQLHKQFYQTARFSKCGNCFFRSRTRSECKRSS